MSKLLWPLAGIVTATVTWLLLNVGLHLHADHQLVDAIRLNIQQSQSRNAPPPPPIPPPQDKKKE